MLVVELRFLTGRYHATPWGRNVNEGAPEWPPSPYRLVRALIDAWKRKRHQWPVEKVEPLLAALASEPPLFSLPPANSAHTRSWLSSNSPDRFDKQLVFDAFVVLSPESPVLIAWPGVDLDVHSLSSLNELLGLLNYLGRSESWVAAGASCQPEPSYIDTVVWNCRPLDPPDPPSTFDIQASPAPQYSPPSQSTASSAWEPVRVACPVPKETYASTSQMSWLDALSMSTSELHKARLDAPPAFRHVTYQRPYPCFSVTPPTRISTSGPIITGVLYSLQSDSLPGATTTVELSERVRRKLMGIHKNIAGGPEKVSRSFSGKDAEGNHASGHLHAYYLPLDTDGDGRIDHMLVIGRQPLDNSERLALDRLQSIWQPDGKPDILFVPVKWGGRESLLQPSTAFASATPFVPPRHFRKGRGDFQSWLASEIRREAQNHGMPAPEHITLIPSLPNKTRTVHWLDFVCNRKGGDVRPGCGFRLKFKEPVPGPFAIGYGAHFGLGLFVPVKKD